jgi:hypothetical protein
VSADDVEAVFAVAYLAVVLHELLTAQIALRRDNQAAAGRALRGLKLPWDHLILASSHARHGRRLKAEELSRRARHEIGEFADRVQSTNRESRPYAPGWPTHLQMAELLACEPRALLERPS